MARINDGVLKNWLDGNVVKAVEYKQEREILRMAINDNHERLVQNAEQIDSKVNKEDVYTKEELDHTLTPPAVDLELKQLNAGLAEKAQQVGMILDVPKQVSAYDKYKVVNDFTNKDDYYEDYINTKWEALRIANPNYVSRQVIGVDSSGRFNIYKYEISNKGNYKKTVVLQGGIHGGEAALTFSLFDFAEELVGSAKSKYKYLEELFNNVRFVIIPVINPYGFTRGLRQNFNGVDINRNYSCFWDTTDEGAGTAWYKGSAPFSESEARISRDLVKATKPDLFVDLHTIWSHTYDFYAESDSYNENAALLRKIFDSALAKKKKEYPQYVLQTGNINAPTTNYNSTSYMHMSRIVGIPSYSLEFCGDSYDGKYSSLEMTKALELLFNVVYYNYLETKYEFRNAHPRDTLGINKSNTPTNMYNFLDGMPLTKKTLGKDASGMYDIYYYQNSHSSTIKKNVLVLGGLTGDFHASAITVGSIIERLVYANSDYYNLTIIPWLNTWGGMQSAQIKNANGVDLSTDFSSLSQVETQYLNNVISANNITDIIHIDNKAPTITGKVQVLKQDYISPDFYDDGVVYTNSVTSNKMAVYARNKKVKYIAIGSASTTQFGDILYNDFTIKFSKYAMNIIKGIVSANLNSAKVLKNKKQYPLVTSAVFSSVTDLEEVFVAEDDGLYRISGTVVFLKNGAGTTYICPILLKENEFIQSTLDSRFLTDEEYTDLAGRLQVSFETYYNANKGDTLKFALYAKSETDVSIYRFRSNRLFLKNVLLERVSRS